MTLAFVPPPDLAQVGAVAYAATKRDRPDPQGLGRLCVRNCAEGIDL
jgi:hypothetical protein